MALLLALSAKRELADIAEELNFLWEKDENVDACRGCRSGFNTLRRKHHCRHCGGIHCDSCTVKNVTMYGETFDRLCTGCSNRESPGTQVKEIVERRIYSKKTPKAYVIRPANIVDLSYGSLVDSTADSKAAQLPETRLFEFMNKSTMMCSLKVILDEPDVDPLREVGRPSYKAAPPQETLHGSFLPTVKGIILMVLLSNPNPIPTENFVYDKRAEGEISPCAAADQFTHFIVYHVRCNNRNVLLKYKGDGVVEARKGDSIARVGFFNKITGTVPATTKENTTNLFGINVTDKDIELLFQSFNLLGI